MHSRRSAFTTVSALKRDREVRESQNPAFSGINPRHHNPVKSEPDTFLVGSVRCLFFFRGHIRPYCQNQLKLHIFGRQLIHFKQLSAKSSVNKTKNCSDSCLGVRKFGQTYGKPYIVRLTFSLIFTISKEINLRIFYFPANPQDCSYNACRQTNIHIFVLNLMILEYPVRDDSTE